jgi:pullulanase/glycogen debranching enzyme
VDGFRFDLMGHHPRANILEVRVALDHLGDAGRDVYLYGEGWNFGEVADDARFRRPPRRIWPAPGSARSTTGSGTPSVAARRST